MRAAASADPRPEIRRRSVASKVSDTASRQAVATPRRPPSVNRVAASISTATAPRLPARPPHVPAAGQRRLRCCHRRDRSSRSGPAPGFLERAGQPSGEVGIRLGDFSGAQGAARSVLRQRVAGDEQLALCRGRRRALRRCPLGSPASRRELGQLVEDDRGAWASHPGGLDAEPPAARRLPVYPQSPRAWLLILGSVRSCRASASARPGSPGSRASSAYSVLGRRWCAMGRARYSGRAGPGCRG